MKFIGGERREIKEQANLDRRLEKHVMRFNARGDVFKTAALNDDPISKEDYHALFSKYINNGDSILVVGAGDVDIVRPNNHQTHELVAVAEEKGAQVLISDLRETNAIIQKEYKEMKSFDHVHVLATDAMRLPLADSSINGIVSSNLINCPPRSFTEKQISIKEQASLLLREFFRVLKPGGFVVITSFGYLEEGKDDSGRVVYNNDIKADEMLSLRELEIFLDKAGFVDSRELLPHSDWHRGRSTKGAEHVESGGFISRKPRNFNIV